MDFFQPRISTLNVLEFKLPLYENKVQAGFPSPIDDFQTKNLDLNEHLIPRPGSTFFVKATGDSMINIGIVEGSLLVVDKNLEPVNGKIVIAVVSNDFTVKRLKIIDHQFYLVPENNKYPTIKLSQNDYIWGVVTSVINKL